MIVRTYEPPFSYHSPNRGMSHFSRMVSSLAEKRGSPLNVISEPLFSYMHPKASRLDHLKELDPGSPAVIYLSDIVNHAAVLVIGDIDVPDLMNPIEYESLDDFLDAPYVRGYRYSDEAHLISTFDSDVIVISHLAAFVDDHDELPNDGLFRVVVEHQAVFICNILDARRYFSHLRTNGDSPFFLPANSTVNLKQGAYHYDNGELRGYLIQQAIPFATIVDDHMDDCFAVSYGWDCWKFRNEALAFTR